MWKLVVAFAVFAAISLFVIFKAGDKADLGGEKHGVEAAGSHAPATAASAPAPATAASAAPAAAPAASAASAAR